MRERRCEQKDRCCGKGIPGSGYRMTQSRQMVIDVLQQTTEHLGADEIYKRVRQGHSQAGLSSIYRILEWLVQRGKVTKFDFGDRKARYELIRDIHDNHHHHLVCKSCNRIIDYQDFVDEEIELVKKTEVALSKKHNFEITDHVIQFQGFCDRCRVGRE